MKNKKNNTNFSQENQKSFFFDDFFETTQKKKQFNTISHENRYDFQYGHSNERLSVCLYNIKQTVITACSALH